MCAREDINGSKFSDDAGHLIEVRGGRKTVERHGGADNAIPAGRVDPVGESGEDGHDAGEGQFESDVESGH